MYIQLPGICFFSCSIPCCTISEQAALGKERVATDSFVPSKDTRELKDRLPMDAG